MQTNAVPPIDLSLRVLVIDDQEQIRTLLERTLTRAGYAVTTEGDVPAARARLAIDQFDVVLTDLQLPSGTGFDVLAAAHGIDPSLPVVFVTGAGDMASAERALEHGALRYLVKPVRPAGLLEVVAEACRARAATRSARAAIDGSKPSVAARAGEVDLQGVARAANFESALDRLWMAMQPIVSLSRRKVVAHEALLRSDEPTLMRPDLLIAAAEALGRLPELGRRIRSASARLVRDLAADVDLFVNLHPSDLEDDDLFDPEAPLSRVAARVVLEITERASLSDLGDVRERIAALRQLGYRVAIDDLGAGYGSLSAMALLRPDIVKLDMSLVRDVADDPVRTRMIRSIGAMCTQLGVPWLCEGVETLDELRALVAVGADLVQGYLFARPTRELGAVTDAIYDAVPRTARDTRPAHDDGLGPFAKQLCRDAVRLCDPSSVELRGVLGELRDVVDLLIK